MKLGLERAKVVQKYFKEKGISENRIIIGSNGEEKPIADHITSAESKNRRTEYQLKNKIMKPLFILLAQSTTGPIIEIVLLLLGAVLIGCSYSLVLSEICVHRN